MKVINSLKIIHRVWKTEGTKALFTKVFYYLNRKNNYKIWIKKNEVRSVYEKQAYEPLVSMVVPVYNVSETLLVECISSVLNQTYTNIELCLVDDCSTQEHVREVLKRYETDSRVKIKYRQENGHISKASNDGLALATGEFVGLLDCDDCLAQDAIAEVVLALNNDKDIDYIYTDEDKITEDGKVRKDPFFKPDWSPDTVMSLLYTCHLSVFRKSILDEVGGFRVGFEGCQDYDLVLRVMEKTNHIYHIPKILYHWRERKESTSLDIDAKSYISEKTIRMKEEAIKRRNQEASIEYVQELQQFRVVYHPVGNAKVSIIILSKDNVQCLENCLHSIKTYTGYEFYEIILVDNGSSEENKNKIQNLCEQHNVRYLYDQYAFNFSKMCNIGAAAASGEYLLFLNDDIEVMHQNWLETLLGHAQLAHVGAVGAKLYYPDKIHIQHCGVLNLQTGPCHVCYKMPDYTSYYFGRNTLDYNYSIVTAACLMVQRSKFDEVGGFDESLPVTYNDVDLCFKLLEHNYYNVVRADVRLIHHESISRGSDELSKEKEERRKRECTRLYEKHPIYNGYDPCYSYHLTQTRGDLSINMEKR